MKDFFKRGDVILILGLIILGASAWLTVSLLRKENHPSAATINSSGGKFEITLKDTLLVIPGPLGATEVQITDDKVWVSKASCPNKLCVRQGKISKPGESIVCLANQVVVTLEGKTRLDAITY